jgi:hypothetical protein
MSIVLVEFKGAIRVGAGETLFTNNLPSDAEILEFKSKESKVSVNGCEAFTIKYGEQNSVPTNSNDTYLFTSECIIAYGLKKS